MLETKRNVLIIQTYCRKSENFFCEYLREFVFVNTSVARIYFREYVAEMRFREYLRKYVARMRFRDDLRGMLICVREYLRE